MLSSGRESALRPALDMLMPAHKHLLASEREVNVSLDQILRDDPEQ